MSGNDDGGPRPGDLNPDALAAAMAAKRMNQSELARQIGVKPQAIQALLSGKAKRTKFIAEIAMAVEKPIASLTWGSGNLRESVTVTNAVVRGIAAGGLWQQENRQVADETLVPVSPDPAHAKLPQVAYRVIGTSMNKLVRDGEYVICIDYREHPAPVRDGDVVVAERHRGGEIERTVKRVRTSPGKIELWPESNDPEYQKPLILKAREEDTTVTIVGRVVGYYRPA